MGLKQAWPVALVLAVVAAVLGYRAVDLRARTEAISASTERIIDGDTIELVDGRRVRLVQIDAPETPKPHGGPADRRGECHGEQSQRVLARLLPPGSRVRLVPDPALDRRDAYGRMLAWVWSQDRKLVQESMAARGAAAPWFFEGRAGTYAPQVYAAALRARSRRAGMWRLCPGTQLDPGAALSTGPARGGAPAVR